MTHRRSDFISRSATVCVGALAASLRPLALRAQALPVLRMGTPANDGATVSLYAVHNGLFKKAGVDAQLLFFSGGTAITSAVLAGALEVGQASLIALMNAHLRGVPLTLVAAGSVYDVRKPFAELVAAIDTPLKTGKDLDGKTIGVPALGDFNTLVTSLWVDRNGGNSATLKFVEIPNSSQIAAIVEHRIDAAVVQQPDLSDGLTSKKIMVVGNAYGSIANSFLIAGWLATTDWATKHRDLVKTFARVMAESTAYTNVHTAETAPLLADAAKIPLDTVARMGRSDSALTLDPTQIQPLIDAAAKYKFIQHAFPAKELIFDAVATK